VRQAATWEHDVPSGLERIALAMARFARHDSVFSRLRLAMSFAPPESESGAASAAFNLELFGNTEEFFRPAALDHGNMKGRHRAYAATFLGTMDSHVGSHLAGASTLGEQTVRGAVRQSMYGIFP
jgi:hypothetical protein